MNYIDNNKLKVIEFLINNKDSFIQANILLNEIVNDFIFTIKVSRIPNIDYTNIWININGFNISHQIKKSELINRKNSVIKFFKPESDIIANDYTNEEDCNSCNIIYKFSEKCYFFFQEGYDGKKKSNFRDAKKIHFGLAIEENDYSFDLNDYKTKVILNAFENLKVEFE